jgi:phosphocarrier protein
MKKQTIAIKNKTGLHSRPASTFILAAKKFDASITIRRADRDDPSVNGKSMARVLSLGISCGDTIEITADGTDESAALNALTALIESGLGD